MKLVVALSLLLVASISATSVTEHSPVSSGQSQNVSPVQSSPVAPVVGSQEVHVPVSSVEHVHHHSPMASYYSPAGMVTVVGSEQSQNKQFKAEQYGQPESASIPANYKPFGSWGLYIGGNPADGYYSNYYKSLANSVEKQQVGGESVKPVGGVTSALSPVLKQAGSSPYQGGDYYPFVYSQNDFSSGSQFQGVAPVGPSSVYSPVPVVPVESVPSSYAPESYSAVKKVGYVSQVQKESSPKESSKSYQSRVQLYPAAGYYAAPVSTVPVQGHPQPVIPYPIPVGSQIVGSQAGVDGAFHPYGVHAFTRYVVKPIVGQEQPHSATAYSATQLSAVNPGYKYSSYQAPVQAVSGQSQYSHYPYYQVGHYAYPTSSQLHYSSGVSVPSSSVHGQEMQYSPVYPIDSVNEKSEDEEMKVVGVKPMKRS